MRSHLFPSGNEFFSSGSLPFDEGSHLVKSLSNKFSEGSFFCGTKLLDYVRKGNFSTGSLLFDEGSHSVTSVSKKFSAKSVPFVAVRD